MTKNLSKDGLKPKQPPLNWTPETGKNWREHLKETAEKSEQPPVEQPLPFRR